MQPSAACTQPSHFMSPSSWSPTCAAFGALVPLSSIDLLSSACKTPFHSTTKGASCPVFLPTPPSAVRSKAASFCSTYSGITFSSSSSRSSLLLFADPPSPFVLGAPVTNGSSLPARSSAGTGWTERDAAALLACRAADCRSAASDSMKRKLSF
eukprot:scaffold39466_cov62-Phaeocystis_antarctica.AAC.4